MPDSLWPHVLQPSRLLCPQDSPGKNTGVGCNFLLQYHSSGSNQTEIITKNKKDYGNHLLNRVQLLVTHGLQPTKLLCPWGFSRQEYWSQLPYLPPGDLPDPGMEPRSPVLQADSLPPELPRKPLANIKKFTSSKCWWGYGEKETLLHFWQECELVQPLWKTIWRFLKKLKIELPCDPAATSGHISKKRKTLIWKNMCIPVF